MNKLTAIKIKYSDGTYSDEIPVAALAENVEWDNSHSLVDILGNVAFDTKGAIQDQITQISNSKVDSTDLNNYVNSTMKTEVTNWLSSYISPATGTISYDASLSIEGAAADAKAAGQIVQISATKPTKENNRIWVGTAEEQYEVLTTDDIDVNYNAYDKVRQFATFTSRTNNGITFTWNADNTVCTVSGGPAPSLASTYLWSDRTSMPTGLEAGTTIKVLYSKTDTYPYLEFVFYDSEQTNISNKLVSADTTVTIPDNTAGMFIRLRVTSGNSVSGTCTAPVILNAYTNEELTKSMDDILDRAFIAEGIINNSNSMTPPYDDADTLPVNTALVYNVGCVPSNAPDNFNGGTFLTFSGQNRGTEYRGTVQICVFKTGKMFARMRWGSTVDAYLSWREFTWESETADADMTSLATFYKIGVIGDSFSSGSISHPYGSYNRYIDLSWPQVLGRDIGATVTNYTWGGLNTKEWLEDSTHGLAKLLANDPEQVYFLALGINDYNDISNGDESLGTIADINEDYTQNPDTFYGNYGRIIGNIQEHAPNAIIIMLSILRPWASTKTMNTSIQEIATHFGIPYIYCDNDSFFTSAFYTENMANNHPVAATYAGMAKAIRRLTESFMVNNPSYFREYYGLT